MIFSKILCKFQMPPRQLESEAMLDMEEVIAYDGLVEKYMGILHEGFVETLFNLGPERGKVLEVGTGTGRIATMLAKYEPDYEVWAVDLSLNMLKAAINNARANMVDGKTIFVLADATRLPFKDYTFDMVFSHNMLHHLPFPEKMLCEMLRVLRPNGALVIRDLKRQPPVLRWLHVHIFGLFYDPIMKRQYEDSIRAALTEEEWKDLASGIQLKYLKFTRQFLTHVTIYRPFLGKRHKRVKLPMSVTKLPRLFYVDSSK